MTKQLEQPVTSQSRVSSQAPAISRASGAPTPKYHKLFVRRLRGRFLRRWGLDWGGAREQDLLALAPRGGGYPRFLSQSFHWTPSQTSQPQSVRQRRVLAPPSVSGPRKCSSETPALSHPSRVSCLRAERCFFISRSSAPDTGVG